MLWVLGTNFPFGLWTGGGPRGGPGTRGTFNTVRLVGRKLLSNIIVAVIEFLAAVIVLLAAVIGFLAAVIGFLVAVILFLGAVMGTPILWALGTHMLWGLGTHIL